MAYAGGVPVRSGQKINEKLRNERDKARLLLEKSQSPMRGTSGRISHLFRPNRDTETPERSNSRQYYDLSSLDISDLVEEKTLAEEMSQKISFDPSEITGRSTMCSKGETKAGKPSLVPIDENFEEILATSRFQTIRDLSKSTRESHGGGRVRNFTKESQIDRDLEDILATSRFQTVRELSKSHRMESFHSDDFVSSDNMKQNILSEDERDWEKEFYAVPGGRKKQEGMPVDFDGFSGFAVPENMSYASDQFSLGALCNKQSEDVGNMICAESPKRAAQCILNITMSSVSSAAPSVVGRTYTAESNDTVVESLIQKLNLSESTHKLLMQGQKKSIKAPLDDITAQEMNQKRADERMSGETVRSGKENHRENREYEEFCRFKSKSPRRMGSNTMLSFSTDVSHDEDNRRSSTRLERPTGTRKRSRSSVHGQKTEATAAVVECRRAKSPSNTKEMRVMSGAQSPYNSTSVMENTLTCERMFLDSGKMSLPSYGLVKGDSKSPGGSAGLTRTTSQLSTASEFSHRDGQLPLKATHGELSWGSVRLRTSITKSIQIKNTSHKRLTIRAVIDGPGFQFGSADVPQMTITLQPQECRGLGIAFCPTIKGPAVGELIFKPPIVGESRIIPLYGYGGHATVVFEGLHQGPVGSKYLPIGDIRNPMRCFEENIRVYNKGSLTAFVCINVENTRSDQRYFTTSVTVNPSRLIVAPSSSATIGIKFTPQRDELKKLLKTQRGTDVIVIGNLVVITGDEPTRHRMKNLTKLMPHHAVTTSAALSGLWNTFPREETHGNLEELKEKAMPITDLAQGLKSVEIALTIKNERTDETVMETSGWMADFDDTVLFRTITQAEQYQEEIFEVTHEEAEGVHVEPREIVRKSLGAETRRIIVKSHCIEPKMLEIDSNHPHLVEILPTRREILPQESHIVLLRFTPGPLPKTPFAIRLQIAHHSISIPIHIGQQSKN